jgi:hypothetical protein
MSSDPAMTMRRPALLQASVAALLFSAAACRRDDAITHLRAAKAPEATAARTMPASPSATDGPPRQAPASGLRWTLPKGWTQKEAGGMRYATLRPPAEQVDVSVVVFPGAAGGELANVNRWRGQLGLPVIDETALASARKTVRTRVGPFAIYDLSSEGEKKSRLIAALAVVGGNTWFLKMVGDASAVGASLADLMRLVEGLRADETN